MKNKITFLQWMLSICISLWTIAVFAQPLSPVFITDSLDIYVEREMARWQIPGVAISIIKDGQVIHQRGYGVRDLETKEAVDENTLFMIGSNTKAFTATAVAMLAVENQCALEDPIKKWVPGFTMVDPWVSEHATLNDVLSHRIGMQTFQGDFMIFDSDLSNAQIIQKIGSLTPVHPFRTTWGYYNTGYLLGGEAIKKISGSSWADFLRERIFTPLEMNRTLALSSEIGHAKNRSAAHTWINGEVRKIDYGNIDAIAPAGSITSSIHDMNHWINAQLNNGKYKDKEVIPNTAIVNTRRPKSIVGRGNHPFNRSHYTLYGLGWQMQDYEGTEIVSHTGGIHGFVTSVTLLPEHNLGIVVLTNTDHNAFYEAVKWEILDAFLELPYRGYSQLYHSYVSMQQVQTDAQVKVWQDSVALKPVLPLPLEAFEGIYRHPVYGTTTMKAGKERLTLNFEHHPQLEVQLAYLGHQRFLATYNQPLYGVQVFPFEIEADQIKAFTLKVADFIEMGDYYFTKE